MNTIKLAVLFSSLSMAGCALIPTDTNEPGQYVESLSSVPLISHRKHLKSTIVNDYQAYQKVNYDSIKRNNPEEQLTLLTSQIEHTVMDLIVNLDESLIKMPVIIRPVTFKLKEGYKTEEGQALIESTLEVNFKKFGFNVFNDRNPRGKLDGNEYVLDTSVWSINDKVLMQVTLKYLDSNKITAVKQIYISDFFFKNMQDGVEVLASQK